jgi:hypothetical protein
MTCLLCKQDPQPPNSEPRKCAFSGDGIFLPDNWCCGTMLQLRDRCVWVHRDDLSAGSIGIVPIPDGLELQGYLVMTWYKSRGSTPNAFVMWDDAQPTRLTKWFAIDLLKALELEP